MDCIPVAAHPGHLPAPTRSDNYVVAGVDEARCVCRYQIEQGLQDLKLSAGSGHAAKHFA